MLITRTMILRNKISDNNLNRLLIVRKLIFEMRSHMTFQGVTQSKTTRDTKYKYAIKAFLNPNLI